VQHQNESLGWLNIFHRPVASGTKYIIMPVRGFCVLRMLLTSARS